MTAGVEGEPAEETAAPLQEITGGEPVRAGPDGDRTAVEGDSPVDRDAAVPVITGSGPPTVQDTAGRPGVPITVEEAYRAKVAAAAAAAAGPSPPQTGTPRDPEVPTSRAAPSPVRPGAPGSGGPSVIRRPPVAPVLPPHLRARPRIEPEQGILGLSRRTRGRLGSRLFNLFFVCVFALILIQMVVALLTP